MRTEPKTTEELMACSERPFMSCRQEVQNDGTIMNIPVVERAWVTPVSEDSIMCAFDTKGDAWRPVYHDGEWFKQRMVL